MFSVLGVLGEGSRSYCENKLDRATELFMNVKECVVASHARVTAKRVAGIPDVQSQSVVVGENDGQSGEGGEDNDEGIGNDGEDKDKGESGVGNTSVSKVGGEVLPLEPRASQIPLGGYRRAAPGFGVMWKHPGMKVMLLHYFTFLFFRECGHRVHGELCRQACQWRWTKQVNLHHGRPAHPPHHLA
jgi:hypothetical protein